MFTTIDQFQDRILGIVERAAPHIARRSSEGAIELLRCRSEMSRILSIYNLFLQREILSPLIEEGRRSGIARVLAVKDECTDLMQDFRAFAAKWREENIFDAWSRYQPESAAFARRILSHLVAVRNLLGLPANPLPARIATSLQAI